ncbi:MAG: mandelate racemase/muconate lactonizing enzyme family protein [Pseudomonadota bacterium]
MNISEIRVTPLRMPLKKPYVWSQGVEHAFTVNLIEMHGEDGSVGYGETTTAPDALAQKRVIEKLARSFLGRSVFDYAAVQAETMRAHFLAFGANMPRFANQLYAGLEMAALDLGGKILDRPVWDLLGGARRDSVGYFYFLQGDTPDELASDARHAVRDGHPIIYLKVGVGEAHDMEAVAKVRAAIGTTRLRLDANEAWDPATALRMICALAPYNVEYIEQPTSSWSKGALRHLKERVPVALGADQSVFTLHDVFEACTDRIADMVAVGPREIGGLRAMIQAAGICEGAGLKICIHSSMTTGITTCAEHHVARAIPNLDDGNQIMWQLMADNVVADPPLEPVAGKLALPSRPGLGFVLDDDQVAKAAERFTAHEAGAAS